VDLAQRAAVLFLSALVAALPVDHQAALVALHVDVLGDVHARQLEAHHRVLALLDDLGGRGEAIEDSLLDPTVDAPRGSGPQRHIAQQRVRR
jgi:hypothetical protein